MNHQSNPYYIPVINALRGIAALMVCLYHFVSTTTGFFEPPVQQAFSIGKYGVQVFFVISGIVIPLSMMKDNYKWDGFPSFFTKRMIRIEPPYLVSLALVVLYTYVRNYVPGVNKIDLTPEGLDILLHLGYLVPFFEGSRWLNQVYWTLAIEFQFYLLISLVLPFILVNFYSRFFSFVSLLVLSFAFPQDAFIFSWISLFIMGIYTALFMVGRVSQLEFLVGLMACSLAHGYVNSMKEIVFGLATVSIVLFFPKISFSAGNFFGKISYSLYLIHSIIGASFINFMTRYGETLPEKIGIVFSGLLLTILSSYWFYRLIEKPSQQASKSVNAMKSFKTLPIWNFGRKKLW